MQRWLFSGGFCPEQALLWHCGHRAAPWAGCSGPDTVLQLLATALVHSGEGVLLALGNVVTPLGTFFYLFFLNLLLISYVLTSCCFTKQRVAKGDL